MNIRNDRIQRLTEAARLYYEQDKTQSEIAKHFGVSRPLISRMLKEAKDLGIVEIRIHGDGDNSNPLLTQLKNIYGIQGGILLPPQSSDHLANQATAASILDYLQTFPCCRLGIGWGHLIGYLVSAMEEQIRSGNQSRAGKQGNAKKSGKATDSSGSESDWNPAVESVCPLIGNSGISIRNYHSNENVRIIAEYYNAQPHYLYTPAFAETLQDLQVIQSTELYKSVLRQWEAIDTAIVNIGNYPSTPDFGSSARYGNRLSAEKAVGRLIAYYYNLDGKIITSETDYAIQVPLPLLARCKRVIGVCSANVSWKALTGALRTGFLTHLIASEQLVRQMLENRE